MVFSDDMTHAAVYIDTSGSMNNKMKVLNENEEARSVSDFLFAGSGHVRRKIWDIAMDIWSSIIGHINVMPLTIRTIHSKGYSRTLKDIGRYTEHQLQAMNFPARNGGTYLWEFLVEEGRELIKNTDKWMFILISDGMDNSSTGKYSGIDGFRSCVDELQKLNIDVEFHIVGLGLPEDACDVFRQVSGSTGGVFYNLGNNNEGDEESLREIVENLNIAIDEAIDPALRARSRRRRQTEYLETCSDGDLSIVQIPSAVPSLDFDEEGVYTRLGVSDLNPDEMEVWENSLLSLAGHSGMMTTQEEHWHSTVSHSSDHRLDSAVRGTWTLDASELAHIARSDINSLFNLSNQIRNSFIPAQQRSLVIRGNAVSENIISMMRGSGARILILPADLPSPPINWETTRLFLEAQEAPFDEGGWSMLPTSIRKPSKFAALYDLFHEVDKSVYEIAVGTDNPSWVQNLGLISTDLSRYLEANSWESIENVSAEQAENISVQFNGIVRFLTTTLEPDTRVFIIRPNEEMMNILESNTNLQIAILNRIDDFLEHVAKLRNSSPLNVEYWPTLHQA
jgi:hypothetical protein